MLRTFNLQAAGPSHPHPHQLWLPQLSPEKMLLSCYGMPSQPFPFPLACLWLAQLSPEEVVQLQLLDSELSKVQLQVQREAKAIAEMRDAGSRAEAQATTFAQVGRARGTHRGGAGKWHLWGWMTRRVSGT